MFCWIVRRIPIAVLVTFLAATAKPRYDLHRKTMWVGKVGIWPFAHQHQTIITNTNTTYTIITFITRISTISTRQSSPTPHITSSPPSPHITMEREKRKYKVHRVKEYRFIDDMFKVQLLHSKTKWDVEYRAQASFVESHPHQKSTGR